tara:strand:+ start:300 stop:662 length:363 start_codon:yes stop_codon:yes gene_type:complete
MRYCFDIDGTICTPTVGREYEKATPYTNRIERINELYDQGHYIIFFTARAMGRFVGDPEDRQKAEELMRPLTEKQLEEWGCKYHELLFGKPHADVFIDDKGVNDLDWFNWVEMDDYGETL